jgi:hypothetical protein
VRFFHDSVQSYLTAVAIGRQDDRMKLVDEAAANPRFSRERGQAGIHAMPELFEMCLHTFLSDSAGREKLRSRILDWRHSFAGAFSRDWVVEQCRRLGVKLQSGLNASGGAALEEAITACDAHDDIRVLGGLYASVAQALWTRTHAPPVDDENELMAGG